MRSLMKAFSVFLVCAAAMLAALPVGAQQGQKDLNQAARQGVPLQTDLTVKGNVTAQAVLIPRKVALHVFGREIANHYAVIELTVANKSPDAALIVQGVYIDYSDWALSGSLGSDKPCRESLDASNMSRFQSCTQPNQVASEEYRVIRGQLLEMQPWTPRNIVVGGLTLIGSVLSGYTFAIKEQGYQKGIAAFSGNVVPGVRAFWPDQTVDEMNRISDVGFRTPMIITKQGSNIVVCFFPIKRFLSESFVDLFQHDPAVFFSPFEMLVDKGVQRRVVKKFPKELKEKFTKDTAGAEKLGKLLPCYLRLKSENSPIDGKSPKSPADELNDKVIKTCRSQLKDEGNKNTLVLLDMISRMSLNTVRVVIDGVMSVETTTLPAKIESVEFDGEKANANFWTDIQTAKLGTIKGAYLTGGVPKIQDADKLGITEVKAITAGSTDETLMFSLKLETKLPEGTDTLTFVVEKTTKDKNGVETAIDSTPYTYPVKRVPEAQKAKTKPAGEHSAAPVVQPRTPTGQPAPPAEQPAKSAVQPATPASPHGP